jgi:ornithine carbamoyltransferase
MKDLLRTEHLSRADVDLLLDTAADFAKNPLRSNTALSNKTVAIYMTKPSTRTRLASETAVAHLGGTPIFSLVAEKQSLIQQRSSAVSVMR